MLHFHSSGRLCRGLGLAGLVFALAASGSLRAATVADSLDQWSLTGTQGENDWYYGWRNFTADGGGVYDPSLFIPFLNDGSNGATPVSQAGPNQWTGTQWDFTASGGPWTFMGPEGAHPNGTNTGEEHWVIRRWVADSLAAPTQLELTSHLRATNTSGPGTTVHLFQNGALLDTLTTNTGAGLTNSVYPTINPGDIIELALTPEGIDGTRADGSDGSAYRLTITDNPPPIPPLADSFDDWSTTGTQGEKNWFNGYYNRSEDADGEYQAEDFMAFSAEQWNGSGYALGGNPPWTNLGQGDTHPNSTTNGAEHWTIRRYVASDLTTTTPLQLSWQMRKTNTGCGDGVSGTVFVNGNAVDVATIAGNDGTGVTRSVFINAKPGDQIDLSLGPNSPADDGCDGSFNRLTIDTELPDGPLYNPKVPAVLLADSVAEFSGTQGQDGWMYGYYDVRDDVENGNGVYDSGDMIPFLNDGSGVVSNDGTLNAWKSSPNHWNGSKWDLLDNGAAGVGPWTEVTNTGGHPAAGGTNRPEVHWAVRRWISDVDGAVRISGLLNNTSASGDGTVGRIIVDGVELWSEKSNGNGIPVLLDLELTSGSLVDFIIDPDGAGVLNPLDPATLSSINDGSDGTTFSISIQEVERFVPIPEPSSILLAGLGLLGLAAVRRRR